MLHRLAPERFHETFGAHAPALRVKSGDVVRTTIPDASGVDATGRRIAPDGNPVTAPVHVEGARPGDTLAVQLRRLEPIGDVAHTNAALQPSALEPEAAREVPPRALWDPTVPEDAWEARWRIERDAGRAVLETPRTALGAFTRPLRPMLGCLGVAPGSGQFISTQEAGPHGGNLDYAGYRAGAWAFLPVFVAGGLLQFGDGHAWQAEGEIDSSGIEAALDVEVLVRVLGGRCGAWPRGADDDDVFVVAAGGTLDHALRSATTEMLRWLAAHGLEGAAAHLLLAQAVRYRLGSLVTIACLLPRRLLDALGQGRVGEVM